MSECAEHLHEKLTEMGDGESLSPSDDLEDLLLPIDKEEYGVSKPKRKIIKARIIND